MASHKNINFFSDPEDSLDQLNIVTAMTCKYYLEQDLHDFFKFGDHFAINLLHINARSIKSNFQKIENLLSNISGTLTAVAITETWLTVALKDVYLLPGY